MDKEAKAREEEAKAFFLVTNGVRWTNNLLAEMQSNQGRYLTPDQARHLGDAISSLNRLGTSRITALPRLHKEAKAREEETKALFLVANGVRWANNLLVEMQSNRARYLTSDQARHLGDAISSLNRLWMSL